MRPDFLPCQLGLAFSCEPLNPVLWRLGKGSKRLLSRWTELPRLHPVINESAKSNSDSEAAPCCLQLRVIASDSALFTTVPASYTDITAVCSSTCRPARRSASARPTDTSGPLRQLEACPITAQLPLSAPLAHALVRPFPRSFRHPRPVPLAAVTWPPSPRPL